MTLVPCFRDRSLQTVLHPLLMADRNLHLANETLNQLLDLEDWLEDTPAPGALWSVRRSIDGLRRTIFYISVFKLQKLTELQRALNEYVTIVGRAPLVDLDW